MRGQIGVEVASATVQGEVESGISLTLDDPYAALSSLDPSGFCGSSAYQTDAPMPLSGLVDDQMAANVL